MNRNQRIADSRESGRVLPETKPDEPGGSGEWAG